MVNKGVERDGATALAHAADQAPQDRLAPAALPHGSRHEARVHLALQLWLGVEESDNAISQAHAVLQAVEARFSALGHFFSFAV